MFVKLFDEETLERTIKLPIFDKTASEFPRYERSKKSIDFFATSSACDNNPFRFA